MSPSASRIPEGVIELTCTGGGMPSARILVKEVGVLEASRRIVFVLKARRLVCANKGRAYARNIMMVVESLRKSGALPVT